jgi:outer membrane lipoprotein-sorting protein
MSSPIKHAFIEATIAILYIHMNNYKQAHTMLSELAEKLPSLNTYSKSINKNSNKNNKKVEQSHIQYLILGIKVQHL